MAISKTRLLDELRAQLQLDLDTITSSQRETEEGATHEESRPENDKDTRALESTYLARGLAQRVAELRAGLAKLTVMRARSFEEDAPVGLGALVTVEDEDGTEQRYFMAPAGGGAKLKSEGAIVKVITPRAPLGRALLRNVAGDEVVLQTPQGPRSLEIVAVE